MKLVGLLLLVVGILKVVTMPTPESSHGILGALDFGNGLEALGGLALAGVGLIVLLVGVFRRPKLKVPPDMKL